MDNIRKKQIITMVICLVVALVIAAIVIFNNPFGHSGSSLKVSIQMLCDDCGAEFEISSGRYKKEMVKKGAIGPMGPTGPPPGLACPDCGQESAYTATKCRKCGAVFQPDDATYNDYYDRCPECGYSAMEEKHRSRKSKK